jgi:chemotaxis protein methyltransferase CheR
MLTINVQEFQKLSQFIKEHYGINLGQEKVALVNGRLANTVTSKGFKNFTEYYQYVVTDQTGQAISELLNKITTNHTYFMRETEHFTYFKEKVLPWLTQTVKDQEMRIWCAGCSRGQEPYTLAMIIDEYLGNHKALWRTDLLATDISDKVLKEAAEGIYTAEEVSPLPDRWKKNYFKLSAGNHYTVTDLLKKELVLRKLNLMDESFPFKKKFQVIFCRNVMIYFDEPTKRNLVEKFHRSLEPGGYLFIGHSETLGRDNAGFRYIQPAVYRRE